MIPYHDAHLAPEPLLYLLPALVEERYHRPVIFTNRGPKLPCGTYDPRTELIEIHLHQIWSHTRWEQVGMAELWRDLLGSCLHEFGHVATIPRLDPTVVAGYAHDHRAYRYVENPAVAWQRRRLAELLTRDTRLAQPSILTGYLGARHAGTMELLRTATTGSGLAFYVAERRKMATGGQLTAGGGATQVRDLVADIPGLSSLAPVRRGDATSRQCRPPAYALHVGGSGRSR